MSIKTKIYGLKDKKTGNYAVLNVIESTETQPRIYELTGSSTPLDSACMWLTGWRDLAEKIAKKPTDADWTSIYEPYYEAEYYDWEVVEFDLVEKALKFKEYEVHWVIDISAADPMHAAIQAAEIQQDPESSARSFSVIDVETNISTDIDLWDYELEDRGDFGDQP